MLAVHFGAGNIGRGFIGKLLHDAGYKVCFVDVNTEIVDLLNQRNEYRVVLASENQEEVVVKDVFAINSITNAEDVIDHIAEADLVTTAVGPNILPIIADVLAKGLQKRLQGSKKPLNIIACENMIGGTTLLKEKVYEKLSDVEKIVSDQSFGFPDAAVDRIVPNQVNEDKLMVAVEPFYEWVVDQSKIVGEIPKIEGITFVDDLEPFIERKLFTVNTGHAITAYLGYQAGLETIKEAMDNEEVRSIVEGALKESGSVLIEKYQFDADAHMAYIDKIIKRFLNPFISDEVTRVGRSPIRKLGPTDRLISPAKQFSELLGKEPLYLVKGIAAALRYDYEKDEEAVQIQETIKQGGYEQALRDYCKLEKDHPLVGQIIKELN
ncbi:mannitol-1-phosphate 5-dehydrogenase [Fredinandcohnia quinoae]|uniref:Mannitol-1-phosphate 5-dehydrogenase n=1 Tax=Fredinandcohnia quinoae TaxID=2918902 RepID=A0AAW5E8Z3_9BACI|nr:mannitol-1-phosphate 5-dehydrogenase [Fredinandcohnia sp. SECRCQ15]MCH1627439.1 mannitol-1-phosphate 5-dehydrogenase [Fredinandcohnia sp. SECRCQ15]